MGKKNKKSNLKDTRAETFGLDAINITDAAVNMVDNDAVEFVTANHPSDTEDPAQIDIEDQIAEETSTKKPQFKEMHKTIRLPGHTEEITNHNLTEVVKCFLIDSEVCTESDFV